MKSGFFVTSGWFGSTTSQGISSDKGIVLLAGRARTRRGGKNTLNSFSWPGWNCAAACTSSLENTTDGICVLRNGVWRVKKKGILNEGGTRQVKNRAIRYLRLALSNTGKIEVSGDIWSPVQSWRVCQPVGLKAVKCVVLSDKCERDRYQIFL